MEKANGETERQRLDRQALLSLSLARLPDGGARAEQFEDFQLMEIGESLQVLASGRDEPGSALRPAIVRRLVDLAYSPIGADVTGGYDDELTALHRALAAEAEVPDVDGAAEALDQHLHELIEVVSQPPEIPPARLEVERDSRINPADITRIDRIERVTEDLAAGAPGRPQRDPE